MQKTYKMHIAGLERESENNAVICSAVKYT